MALFDLSPRTDRNKDASIVKKVNSAPVKAPITVKGGGGLMDKIRTIEALVEKNLGKYRDRYVLIQDEALLDKYLDTALSEGIISLDTETTGLNPLLDDIAGVCIYVPGLQGAYLPINHVSYVTGNKIPNQLDVSVIKAKFEKLFESKIDVIMFNAVFDIRFMRNKVGVKNVYCTWDCMIAQRLLNENEESNALKKLHQKYCLNGKEDAFTFDELFHGIPFIYIPLHIAVLYAAHDPEITYEFYLFQKKYLRKDSEKEDMRRVYWVFENIEMPLIEVVADMEDTGVKFDFAYNDKLKNKYHRLLAEREDAFHKVCDRYADRIQKYRDEHRTNCKLDNPINIGSSTQLAILLYDILECPMVVDKRTKKPSRSTAEQVLKDLNNDVSKAILDYREFSTIVSTFIDKLPECVNPNDGRIHCKFNQYGADTGRMSSSDPNMQNIPSHITDIRKMFIASAGENYVEASNNCFIIDRFCEVNTSAGWKFADKVVIGDKLLVEEDGVQVEIFVTKIDNLVDKNQIVYYYE